MSCAICDKPFLGMYLTELEMEHLFKNSLSLCTCDGLSVQTLRFNYISQTTTIIPSKFKFTFSEFTFALSSTCVVPRLTGGIKNTGQNASFLQCTSKGNIRGFFWRELFYSSRKLPMQIKI